MHGQYIVSIKVDDRGFVVHKWTKKIVDLKQVYLVVKDNRKIYQLALEFALRPGEKKPFTDVLQFDPATSRHFTQIISTTRKELLKRNTGGDGAAPQRFSDKYREEVPPQRSYQQQEQSFQPAAAQEQSFQPAGSQSNAFASAIANAQNRSNPAFQPAPSAQDPFAAPPSFTPSAANAVNDPFAAQVPMPPSPGASFNGHPSGPVSSTGNEFNAMMQSVQANGHQMQTLFSTGGGAVADPFAAPAPAATQAAAAPFDPFAAQDPGEVARLLRLIDRLRAEGVGVVAVLHDANVAWALAERILLLSEGRLVADGPRDEVLVPDRLERLYGAPFRGGDGGCGPVPDLAPEKS